MTGLYEYSGFTDKGNESEKFWRLTQTEGGYLAEWGPIRRGRYHVQGKKLYSYGKAVEVVRNKLRKGYDLIEPEEQRIA